MLPLDGSGVISMDGVVEAAGAAHSGGVGAAEAGAVAEVAGVAEAGVEVFLVGAGVSVVVELPEVGDAYGNKIFFNGS